MTPCEKILETAVREKAGAFLLVSLFECNSDSDNSDKDDDVDDDNDTDTAMTL